MSGRGRGGRRMAKAKAKSKSASNKHDVVADEQENDEPIAAVEEKEEETVVGAPVASTATMNSIQANPPAVQAPLPKAKSKYRPRVVSKGSETRAVQSSSPSFTQQSPNTFFGIYACVSSLVNKPPSELRPPLLTDPPSDDHPQELKPEDKELIEEMLSQLRALKDQLGGVKTYRGVWELDTNGDPKIIRKLTRRELQDAYTDYEYVVLHIKGFVAIEQYKVIIIKKNNHQFFTTNPGVKLLEAHSGITLHGDRPEANSIVESAFSVLINAFKLAKSEGDFKKFFTTAFDRTADPCLEGRVGRLQLYIENSPYYWKSDESGAEKASQDELVTRWRDFNLLFEERAAEEKEACLGEFLRVFLNTASLKYAKSVGSSYDVIQNCRAKGLPLPEFYDKFCNVKLLKEYLQENNAFTDTNKTKKTPNNKKKNEVEPVVKESTPQKPRCPFAFTPHEINQFIETYSEFLTA